MTFSFVYIGNEYHSYGYSGLKVAERLNGARLVDLLPEVGASDGDDWTGPPWQVAGPGVAFTLPEWWPHIQASPMVGFTMFEGHGLPRERVRIVNETCQICLVPSQWCKEGFEESGVKVPVRVVPLGVDAEDWPFMKRAAAGATTPGRPYRFLWNGLPDSRKGWDLVYKAFWEAFRGSEEVELWLHFRKGLPIGQWFADKNVRVYNGYHSQSILKRMMREVDCYVYPSRAEGWGLPPREAASTGLPVIATDYSGMAEDIREWALPLRACKEVETRFQGAEDEPFQIGEPCLPDLVELMRWCFENPGAAREIGRKASAWLHAHGGWDVTVRGILEAVGEVAGSGATHQGQVHRTEEGG